MDNSSFVRNLLEDEQDLSMRDTFMVHFGTPNIFVALWFELDYGTNPPLGTLMLWKVQLCMCIWKCYVFVGKHGLKGRSHNKFEEANEESRSCSSAWWNQSQKVARTKVLQRNIPEDYSVKTELHARRPPILDVKMIAKMMQLKGSKCKMARGPTWRKGRPNRAEVGMGRSAQATRPGPF
jgi:hypothetical protein